MTLILIIWNTNALIYVILLSVPLQLHFVSLPTVFHIGHSQWCHKKCCLVCTMPRIRSSRVAASFIFSSYPKLSARYCLQGDFCQPVLTDRGNIVGSWVVGILPLESVLIISFIWVISLTTIYKCSSLGILFFVLRNIIVDVVSQFWFKHVNLLHSTAWKTVVISYSPN